MDADKKLLGTWWVWVVFLLIATGIVLFGLNALGLIGQTIVERKVFENSYQYSEARKTAVAMYEAQLAEIQQKLINQSLDQNTRNNLEAQASAIRIRLATERSKQ